LLAIKILFLSTFLSLILWGFLIRAYDYRSAISCDQLFTDTFPSKYKTFFANLYQGLKTKRMKYGKKLNVIWKIFNIFSIYFPYKRKKMWQVYSSLQREKAFFIEILISIAQKSCLNEEEVLKNLASELLNSKSS